MTTTQLDTIYNTLTAGGSLPMTRALFGQAAKEVIAAMRTRRTASSGYYQKYVDAWSQYFKHINGIAPRFRGVDGKAMKEIMTYLERRYPDADTALAVWQGILARYHTLDPFFRLNLDLKFINSQLEKIITHLKYATDKATKGHNATDLRREL
jgi:hypothetical protein